MFVTKKKIKNKEYYYLIHDTKTKRHQIYLGKNRRVTKKHKELLKRKMFRDTIDKRKIVNCLKHLKPTSIVLFGSYAKGTQKKHSDIDLLLICKDLPIIPKRQELVAKIQLKYLTEKIIKGFLYSQYLIESVHPDE